MPLLDAGLAERLLRQSLTVIERAGYRDCAHVPSERTHLAPLPRADSVAGEQGYDAVAFEPVEGARDGPARVPRGGDEDRPLAEGRLRLVQLAHQLGHESGTHVLECARGAVVEFEYVDSRFDLDERNRERKRRPSDPCDRACVDVALQQALRAPKRRIDEFSRRWRCALRTQGG